MRVNVEGRRWGEEFFERAGIDLQGFGFDVGSFGVEGGGKLEHLLGHSLIGADASVFVRDQMGVELEPLQFPFEAAAGLQGARQLLRGGTEFAAELSKLGQLGSELVFLAAPSLVGGIERGEIPFVLVRDFAAVTILRWRSNG